MCARDPARARGPRSPFSFSPTKSPLCASPCCSLAQTAARECRGSYAHERVLRADEAWCFALRQRWAWCESRRMTRTRVWSLIPNLHPLHSQKTPFPLRLPRSPSPGSTDKAQSEEGRTRVRRRAAAGKVCVLVCMCTFVRARVCTCVQHPSRVHVGGSGFCTQRVESKLGWGTRVRDARTLTCSPHQIGVVACP